MLARSIKVGSTKVRVGPGQTPLAALKQLGNQSANATSNAFGAIRSNFNGLVSNTSNAGMAVLTVGLLSIICTTTLVVKPELVVQIKQLPLFAHNQNLNNDAAQTADATDIESRRADNAMALADRSSDQTHPINVTNKASRPVDAHQQQWVTNWLSKRYRVAGDATNVFVSTAYKTAKETKLDPLLILAVMAIESGLNPFAESPVGAQGLMQVMSKIHEDKFEDFGGVKAALNPTANIKVGSLILKDYVTQGGSIEAGLKRYVGAAAFATDGGYGNRVLAEYSRLKEVATGKNVPSNGSSAPMAVPKQRPTPETTRVIDASDINAMPAEAAADVREHNRQQAAYFDQIPII
ncbi:transglycosylase SLT domain-containing protein [Glaciimonas sp. GG7]